MNDETTNLDLPEFFNENDNDFTPEEIRKINMIFKFLGIDPEETKYVEMHNSIHILRLFMRKIMRTK